MSLRLYTSKEDSENFSKSFSTKLYPKFDRSTFLFVDFSINKSYKDVFKIQVFYSENGFFYTKFISKEIIRHAFGKWNQLNFMLARDKNKPLTPLFIFDFPLDNSKSPYGASFANINGDLHILSKIYDLSDEHFKLLKKSYKLYKVKGRDYVLFDFGNCFSFIDKFLKNLETILDDIDFKLNDSNELIVNPIPLDSIRKREDDYKYCMICGRKLESTINKNLLELSRKFPARCVKCLEKIYALELYYKLNEGSTNMLSLSELKYIWDEEGLFKYNFELLNEYRFLEPFSEDIYKLHLNNDINESFNSLLNPIEEKEEELESKSALDDYFGFNDQKEKIKCRICGEEIEEDDGTDICSNCFDKQMTIEKIHKLIEYVKPGTGFSKSSLIEKGFNHIDLDIIINDLEENDLLRYDSDDLLILANRTKLNEFIREYSDSDEYIIEKKEEDLEPQLIIYKNDLTDESSLNKAINLIDYQEYVECSPNRREGWDITLKKDGKNFLHQLFYSPFQAKLTAVRYLNEIGVIKIAENPRNIKSKNKIGPKNKYVPPRKRLKRKFKFKCPVCGREFISYKKENDMLCSTCVSKYGFFEKKALEGVICGEFDKNLLSNILLFREEGMSDREIAKNLKLDHDFLIKPLIKFLSDDNLLNKISENQSKKSNFEMGAEDNIKTEIEVPSTKDNESIVSSDDNQTVNISEHTVLEENLKNTKEKLVIPEDILNSQYLLDEKIDFDKYMEHCYISSVGNNKVIFKENGELSSIKQYTSSYEAKLSMINHLQKLGIIEVKYEESSDSYDSRNFKVCPICQKRFSLKGKYNSTQKYCDVCKSKYNNFELKVLTGINEGIYTESMALRIKELLDQGNTKTKVASMLNISNASLITPILKFFLSNESTEEKSIKAESVEKLDKVCHICGKEFVVDKDNGQKYCNDCKLKFSPIELSVLYDIEQGKYTEKTAIEIAKLKQDGKTNKQISNALKLPHPGVITPILNFLLKYADLSDEKETEINIKVCPICKKEFSPKSSNGSDIYCSICKKKFAPTEIQVLMGIIEGKYNTKLANRLKDLKNIGFSNTFISSEENIPLALINPIISILLTDDKKIEGIYYNDNSSKWVVEVDENSKTINLGTYCTKEEAILARDKYYSSNFTNESSNLGSDKEKKDKSFNKSLEKELETVLQNDINKENLDGADDLKIVPDRDSFFVYSKDKLLGIFSSEEKVFDYLRGVSVDEKTVEEELDEKPVKQFVNKDIGNDHSAIILNGIISERDRRSIFNFISFVNCNLNKIICEKLEDNNYNFLLDIEIEKSNLNSVLKDLKNLGWENAI